ncbi:unnamed protein product [Kluyveromyces dobzhanskii CBS 2104]|uniref:WGS project CCBQ000000000 data, contig 00017 n=1 Tax=Kluyveromyces dobzhanskii CBS 2104 TaxID=1427455 RepID=A0A0A8L8D0_9SACH|nr:unnamed protein product [Kluyveromyces dobzhanskii CBS 2104]
MDSSKDADNRPVLFMGTQTENLDYMYELVHELSGQLRENEKLREAILEDVDLLSRQLNRGIANVTADVNVAQRFIDQRLKQEVQDSRGLSEKRLDEKYISNQNPDQGKSNKQEDTVDSEDTLGHVIKQNEKLKQILLTQQKRNAFALGALRHHDEGLQKCVAMLRDEIYSHHMAILSQARDYAENRLFKAEDSQFDQYLRSVSDLQQLLDICKLYRTLLRAHS